MSFSFQHSNPLCRSKQNRGNDVVALSRGFYIPIFFLILFLFLSLFGKSKLHPSSTPLTLHLQRQSRSSSNAHFPARVFIFIHVYGRGKHRFYHTNFPVGVLFSPVLRRTLPPCLSQHFSTKKTRISRGNVCINEHLTKLFNYSSK